MIKQGMKEQGKVPSRSINLHRLIYEKHPEIRSLLNAFDRLEAAEVTVHSILFAMEARKLVHISDEEVEDINVAFNLN